MCRGFGWQFQRRGEGNLKKPWEEKKGKPRPDSVLSPPPSKKKKASRLCASLGTLP